ncbi:MAG: hypothetical protein IIZ44_00810 [Muribaculaceae bacterium]|nr:hypothetical protein [Muribaculaceae bacterium]
MAYDRDEIFQQAQAAIRDHNLFFAADIIAFLPISETTYYEFFPPKSEESECLKKMLEANKIRTKASIRNKLYKGKGGDLIALYKMICTDEERKALSMSYVENKHSGSVGFNTMRLIPEDEE